MDLKQKCRSSEPGNTKFWPQVQKLGTLIGDKEVAKHSGKSANSESKAVQVGFLFYPPLMSICAFQ